MKAIFVVDIEKDVDIKTLRADFEVYGDIRIKPYYQDRKGVELKPIPHKREAIGILNDYERGKILGFNSCLKIILGDTE